MGGKKLTKSKSLLVFGVDTGIANTAVACGKCKQTKLVTTTVDKSLGMRIYNIITNLDSFFTKHAKQHNMIKGLVITEQIVSFGARRYLDKTKELVGALRYYLTSQGCYGLLEVRPVEWKLALGVRNSNDSIYLAKKKGYTGFKKKDDDHQADAGLLIEYYRLYGKKKEKISSSSC